MYTRLHTGRVKLSYLNDLNVQNRYTYTVLEEVGWHDYPQFAKYWSVEDHWTSEVALILHVYRN
jgi:hypothetical protein